MSNLQLHDRSRAARRGYTTIELIIVMVIIGVLSAAVTKPIMYTWRFTSRQAAARETAAYLYRARAASAQQSRATWFVRNGNTIKVLTDSSGKIVPYGAPLNLNSRHGVTLAVTKDTIAFDPRGFTRIVTPAPRIIVTNASGADTLCISGLGTIATRKCA
jgi:prepilin-type N-terminal cleavage/methylation domain-containing protein